MQTVDLEISKIRTGKYSLREDPSKAALRLAASVEEVGLLHPLIVLKEKRGKYDLVAGHVRLETLKQTGAIHF